MAARNSGLQDEDITKQNEDNTRQNEDSTQKHEDTKLTIESMPEIERKKHEKMSNKDRHKPSKFAVVIKWLFTIIFGILLLACLTVSKTSILALSEAMSLDPELDINSRCRLFVKLQILTLVPNIINLLISLWAGAFRQDLPMPSGKTILCVGVALIDRDPHPVFMDLVTSSRNNEMNELARRKVPFKHSKYNVNTKSPHPNVPMK